MDISQVLQTISTVCLGLLAILRSIEFKNK